MDKKKGFTLVELLAVIVILAIIALIATPIILNVISDAKKEAAKDSAYGYIEAIENAIIMNDFEEDDNFLSPNASGCYELKKLDNKVNIKGTKPKIDDKAQVCLKDGTVTNLTGVEIDGYEFTYANDELSMNEKSKKYTVYANGTEIYYNPETGKKCTTAVSTPGTKSGCMEWYAFNDDDKSSTVNVILDHNTTANVAWNSTGNNSEMKEVKIALENDTKDWKSDLNPRLITANEIAKITGHPTFDASKENQDWFYLDSNNQTQIVNSTNKSKYAWLFDYTFDCTNNGCNTSDLNTWGYWTSTTETGTTSRAWLVDRDGDLSSGSVTIAVIGVRPVITISKSNI